MSVSTIRRSLLSAGLITPAPRKRPKTSYIRFEADLPNETWQSDFTHIWLADGTDTETITWLDDHSRKAQQTMKKWTTAIPPANTINELQRFLDEFVDIYNHRRAHTAIGKVPPAIAYDRLPKDIPNNQGAGNHYRIRHDIIDKTGTVSLRRAGNLHHISLGRPLKGTPVILIIDDLDTRVVNKQTGELIRHFKLNPNIGYQPRFKNAETPEPGVRGFPMS